MFLSNVYSASNTQGVVPTGMPRLFSGGDSIIDIVVSADTNTVAAITYTSFTIKRRSGATWTTPINGAYLGGTNQTVAVSDNGDVVVVAYETAQYDPPDTTIQGYLPSIRIYRYNGSSYTSVDIQLSTTRYTGSTGCRAVVSRDGNYIVTSWPGSCRCYNYNGSSWVSKGDKSARQVPNVYSVTAAGVGLLTYNATTQRFSSPLYVYDFATWSPTSLPTKQFTVYVDEYYGGNVALSADGNYAYSLTGTYIYTASTTGTVGQIETIGGTIELLRSQDGKHICVRADSQKSILIYNVVDGVPVDGPARVFIPVVGSGFTYPGMPFAFQAGLLYPQTWTGGPGTALCIDEYTLVTI